MTWYAWLLTIIGPLVLKVLVTLGIGLVTFTGISTAFDALITMLGTNWASVPADVIKLASLAGIPQALGLILGAMNARITLWVAMNAKRWVTR